MLLAVEGIFHDVCFKLFKVGLYGNTNHDIVLIIQ